MMMAMAVNGNKSKAFKEISNAKIGNNRTAVISKMNDGSFTIGQRVTVLDDGKKPMNIFLKGAVHASNLEALQSLRDAITVAIEVEEVEESKKLIKKGKK